MATKVATKANGRRDGRSRTGRALTSEGSLSREALVSSQYVENPMFSLRSTETKLFGQNARKIIAPTWVHFPEVPEDIQPRPRGKATLSQEDEIGLFLRYNYSRYRLSKLAEAQQRRRSSARAKQITIWATRATQARIDLVSANMALVIAMAKRTRIPNVEFSELVSEGNMALLRSVEKFDVARGFKFSTYACRAILKSFNRMATKTGRYRQHFPTEYDPDLDRSDYDTVKHEMQREDSVESLREVLTRNAANLSNIEQTIITERFALASRGKKRTLAEVGQMVGLTNERVRQIQILALAKIRAVLDGDYLAA